MHSFLKNQLTFEERRKKSQKFRKDNPNRVPIAIDSDKLLSNFTKNLLTTCPGELTVLQFYMIFRNNMKIPENLSIFFLVNNTIPVTSMFMETLYARQKDDDGFLYMSLHLENVFG